MSPEIYQAGEEVEQERQTEEDDHSLSFTFQKTFVHHI